MPYLLCSPGERPDLSLRGDTGSIGFVAFFKLRARAMGNRVNKVGSQQTYGAPQRWAFPTESPARVTILPGRFDQFSRLLLAQLNIRFGSSSLVKVARMR